MDTPYRKYQYYASFTDAQYESLILLLRYLTAEYNIPRDFIPETTRYEVNKANAIFKGIVTHANFRPSGKWDLGTAFEWEK